MSTLFKKRSQIFYIIAGLSIGFLVAIFLVFRTYIFPGDTPRDRNNAWKHMSVEEQDLVDQKLDRITQQSTYNDVINLLGKPTQSTTMYFSRYTYACPTPSPSCSIVIDFLKGRAYRVSFTSSGKFAYISNVSDKPSDTIQLAADDPSILSSRKQAQEEIGKFKERVNANACFKGSNCSIKRDFVVNGIHEHMWVDVYSYNGGVFYGELANQPERILTLSYGDRVSTPILEVEDWILYDSLKDTMDGGFSVIARGAGAELEDLKKPSNMHAYRNTEDSIRSTFNELTKKGTDFTKKQDWHYGVMAADKTKLEEVSKVFVAKGLSQVSLDFNADKKQYILVLSESRIHAVDSFTERVTEIITYTVEHDDGYYLGWNLGENNLFGLSCY